MAKSAVTTYGEALYQTAVESSKCSEMLSEAKELKQILSDNPELGSLMANPRFDKEEHLRIIADVFKGRLSEELFAFLDLLVKKNRYTELKGILDYFILRAEEQSGIGHAKVTSAAVIDDSTKKKIEQKLLETTKYKSVEIEYEVDESLIGGMIIRIKDRIVDNSVKTKLENITRDLHKIQI